MTTRAQGIRFALVGIASNLLLYLLYVGMTRAGLGHKIAMTLSYAVGVLQTFAFNKTWTFGHGGRAAPALKRYCVAYAGCYLLQLGILHVLVDRAGMDHLIVQGVAICTVACVLFFVQKHWVFATQ